MFFLPVWMLLGFCFPGVSIGASPRNGSDNPPAASRPADGQLAHPCAVQANLRPGKALILLGRLAQEPYVVVVPGRDRRRLSALRTCVPDALILPSRRGSYIHVASFADRTAATHLSQHLRQLGFDARVAYFE